MAGKSQSFKIMANEIVYSWADKLWQRDPPRKYIATRQTAPVCRQGSNNQEQKKLSKLLINTRLINMPISLIFSIFIVLFKR